MSVAYPNGRCDICGTGLSAAGVCPECDRPTQRYYISTDGSYGGADDLTFFEADLPEEFHDWSDTERAEWVRLHELRVLLDAVLVALAAENTGKLRPGGLPVMMQELAMKASLLLEELDNHLEDL